MISINIHERTVEESDKCWTFIYDETIDKYKSSINERESSSSYIYLTVNILDDQSISWTPFKTIGIETYTWLILSRNVTGLLRPLQVRVRGPKDLVVFRIVVFLIPCSFGGPLVTTNNPDTSMSDSLTSHEQDPR